MCNQLVLRVYLLVIHVNRLVSIIYTCIFAFWCFVEFRIRKILRHFGSKENRGKKRGTNEHETIISRMREENERAMFERRRYFFCYARYLLSDLRGMIASLARKKLLANSLFHVAIPLRYIPITESKEKFLQIRAANSILSSFSRF